MPTGRNATFAARKIFSAVGFPMWSFSEIS
jgi:hypothetical protein